jgi:uncharacterized protein
MNQMETFLPQIINSLKNIDPLQVILFGSMVSGNINEDSDIDLVVILDNETLPNNYEEKLQNKIFVRNAILDISFKVAIDLLVYTKMEFEKLKNIGNPFLKEITEKGKIIYEKTS